MSIFSQSTIALFVCLSIFIKPQQISAETNDRPNVLFILDTSGSMGVRGSSGQIRMDELKSAMTTVLSTMQNVNVGLMRFNDASAQDGGPVLFPVSFIDGNVNNVVGDLSLIHI